MSSMPSSPARQTTPQARRFLDDLLGVRAPSRAVWTPLAGPQASAYTCDADELFYGGAAGGGKTDLLLGLAGTAHWRTVLFRREFPRMRSIIERSREVFNADELAHSRDGYNESLHIWRLADGRMIEFAAMQYEHDRKNYQGRPHDLYGFDEVTEFTETQYRFVIGWNRTTRPGQRCRVVATGNPPTDAEGEWVIRYWAPWLDPAHARPAEPGELRWFATIEGKDVEVESGAPFTAGDEVIQPRSRTFIPARLSDNPILEATGYRSVLQGLPEPLRSQLLYGDFTQGLTDDPWQCIPTEWVRAAQARWADRTPDVALRALGVDVARGGQDETVIAPLYGTYVGDLRAYPGAATPDGATVARYVTDALGASDAPVFVDVIGYGASAFDHLRALHGPTFAVNNAAASQAMDRTRRYRFVNLRAESYWKLREALDPASGEDMALPPSRQLRVDLCAPRYRIVGGKIALEAKDEIKKRTGRSPDYGDAVVLAWHGCSRPAASTLVDVIDL